LAKPGLGVNSYNGIEANAEFSFIDPRWRPPAQMAVGLLPASARPTPSQNPSAVIAKLPPLSQIAGSQPSSTAATTLRPPAAEPSRTDEIPSYLRPGFEPAARACTVAQLESILRTEKILRARTCPNKSGPGGLIELFEQRLRPKIPVSHLRSVFPFF
jgi:hypothetical protein